MPVTLDFLNDFDFFAGVPDSLLRPLCDHLTAKYGVSGRHIIAANEGNACALAAGYYFSTGKTPVVYLQNSGIGNIVNPVCSLMNKRVYAAPCLFIVGWRGEPGVHDEPQHIFQGMNTLTLLRDMEIEPFVVGPETTDEALRAALVSFQPLFAAGRQAALVVRKGALQKGLSAAYQNDSPMTREHAIAIIAQAARGDAVVSTTGKASRELFELREKNAEPHETDFLTVGSMGHASSIALAVALNKPALRVWCVDGDGALLMHMGALPVIGASAPRNLIHVLLNNRAHETVGGMPTAAGAADLPALARACGYPLSLSADTPQALAEALEKAKAARTLAFVEARCGVSSRADLGRPTSTALQNRDAFMRFLQT